MRRGFEKVSGYEYVNFPKRKTKQSAGYDIESAVNVVINPGETKLIQTGIKAYMDENEWLGIYIRSSLAIKYGLVLANSVAVIDSDYYNNPENEGHIMMALRNTSGSPCAIKVGDRIAQGIFNQYYKVDDDSADGDRTGGMGSTGKWMEITVGSLFDGIGGWCIAAERNGAVPVWSSEIEPFCIEVTKKHFPNVMQLGDIRKIKGDKIPPVDIICAGSPCQDLSVAGKREGLKGERSGLFRTANDIVSDMLNATKGEYPKYFIWENVLGAFSSNKGRDFQAVLSEITQANIPMPRSGKWARSGMVRSKRCHLAWRVLDAQYWGVPQHRERIFLIASFRNRGGVDRKYYLSPKACQGILRRAKARKKRLPELLYQVLKHQSMISETDK